MPRSLVALLVLTLPRWAEANPPDPQHVRFDATPTLRQVTPRRHYPHGSDSARIWRHRTKAALEFAAMARELYGDRTLTFIARDGLLLHHVFDYLAGNDPSGPQLKVVGFSGNGTTTHPELPAYLRDQGLAPTDVQGKGCAFFDCAAGSGRTFFRFRELVDGGTVGHVLASQQARIPPLRIALFHLDRRAGSMTFDEHIGVSHARWEFDHIAHPTGTIAGFAEHAGRVEAFAPPSPPAVQEEALRWREHVRYLLDRGIGRLYERRRTLWKTVREIGQRGDARGYLRFALGQYDGRRPEAAEAIVRDILHVGLTNLAPLEKQVDAQLGPAAVAELWDTLSRGESVRATLERLVGD